MFNESNCRTLFLFLGLATLLFLIPSHGIKNALSQDQPPVQESKEDSKKDSKVNPAGAEDTGGVPGGKTDSQTDSATKNALVGNAKKRGMGTGEPRPEVEAATGPKPEAVHTVNMTMVWVVAIAGILLIPIGIYVMRMRKDTKYIAAGILCIFIGPIFTWGAWQSRNEYAIINDQSVEFWGSETEIKHKINYTDLDRLEFEAQEETEVDGKKEIKHFTMPILHLKDGTKVEINSIILDDEVLDDLISRFKRDGIPIEGKRQDG